MKRQRTEDTSTRVDTKEEEEDFSSSYPRFGNLSILSDILSERLGLEYSPSDKDIIEREVKAGKNLKTISFPHLAYAEISGNNVLIYTVKPYSTSNTLSLWNVKTKDLKWVIEVNTELFPHFTPDGKHIIYQKSITVNDTDLYCLHKIDVENEEDEEIECFNIGIQTFGVNPLTQGIFIGFNDALFYRPENINEDSQKIEGIKGITNITFSQENDVCVMCTNMNSIYVFRDKIYRKFQLIYKNLPLQFNNAIISPDGKEILLQHEQKIYFLNVNELYKGNKILINIEGEEGEEGEELKHTGDIKFSRPTLSLDKGKIMCVNYSEDSQYIAVGVFDKSPFQSNVVVVNLSNRESIEYIKGVYEGWIKSIQFDNEGYVFTSGGYDGKVKFINNAHFRGKKKVHKQFITQKHPKYSLDIIRENISGYLHPEFKEQVLKAEKEVEEEAQECKDLLCEHDYTTYNSEKILDNDKFRHCVDLIFPSGQREFKLDCS